MTTRISTRQIEDIVIGNGASLFLFKLADENLQTLFNDLQTIRPRHYEQFKYMGKVMRHARKYKIYGQPYYFCGKRHAALDLQEAPTSLVNVMRLIENVCRQDYRLQNVHFNSAIVNWYTNGTDYISKHSDDERDIANNPPIIVTLSLGQERVLRLRNKRDGKIVRDIRLSHGDVYIMFGENFQKEYTHEIPKVNGRRGLEMIERISVTLRELKINPNQRS